MLTAQMKLDRVQMRVDCHNKEMAKMKLTFTALEELADAGLDLVQSQWNISNYHDVAKTDLSTIRKVFGKLTMTSKDTAFDFDTSNEVIVTMAPVKAEYAHMRFAYRVGYRPGRCKVIRNTSSSTSLVCEV